MAILYAVSLVISFSLLFSFNGVTSVPLLPPNGNFVGTEVSENSSSSVSLVIPMFNPYTLLLFKSYMYTLGSFVAF